MRKMVGWYDPARSTQPPPASAAHAKTRLLSDFMSVLLEPTYGHPATNAFWKHRKSNTSDMPEPITGAAHRPVFSHMRALQTHPTSRRLGDERRSEHGTGNPGALQDFFESRARYPPSRPEKGPYTGPMERFVSEVHVRAATGRERWFDDPCRDGYVPEHSLPVVPRWEKHFLPVMPRWGR